MVSSIIFSRAMSEWRNRKGRKRFQSQARDIVVESPRKLQKML
jgi:hypothetical protein